MKKFFERWKNRRRARFLNSPSLVMTGYRDKIIIADNVMREIWEGWHDDATDQWQWRKIGWF